MSIETGSSKQVVPSRERVLAEVKQIVAEFASMRADAIREQDSLETDLGCDSLDAVEITMEVEEHFGVSIPDEMSEQVRTVGDIADGVAKLLQ